MSAYAEYVTEFDNAEMLIQCLKESGFAEVEYHETAQHLIGYHGDTRQDTAEIIVRRKFVGSASNDIGYKRGEDGKFRAIISEYDSHTYDRDWQTRLADNYCEKKTIKTAQRLGLRFTGKKKVGTKTELKFVKN